MLRDLFGRCGGFFSGMRRVGGRGTLSVAGVAAAAGAGIGFHVFFGSTLVDLFYAIYGFGVWMRINLLLL